MRVHAQDEVTFLAFSRGFPTLQFDGSFLREKTCTGFLFACGAQDHQDASSRSVAFGELWQRIPVDVVLAHRPRAVLSPM